MLKSHLLIDGFNLLHAVKGAGAQRPFFDVKSMVYCLEHAAASCGRRATIVFDGSRFENEVVSSKTLQVVFSRPGQSADEVMERFMERIPGSERIQWVLVSNDRLLGQMALGSGFRWMRCSDCIRDMVQFQKGNTSFEGKNTPSRVRKPFNNPFKEL